MGRKAGGFPLCAAAVPQLPGVHRALPPSRAFFATKKVKKATNKASFAPNKVNKAPNKALFAPNKVKEASGVKETSYYGTIENLFNEVGKALKPKVRCVINLQNQGAGLPDGGLYTADQFQKRTKVDPLEGQLPARGCFEVKSPGEDVLAVAKGEQVRRYLNKYRQVLLTNYRDFILVGLDRDGNLEIRERFTLAANEADFWNLAAHPQAAANELLGERFVEYLKRVMLHAAPLALPKDVAWFLASYARDAKARIESSNLPALITVRSALEEALGLKFEGEKGEHFFRSTLVQTLFYGVFS
jgi:hypothetical protein